MPSDPLLPAHPCCGSRRLIVACRLSFLSKVIASIINVTAYWAVTVVVATATPGQKCCCLHLQCALPAFKQLCLHFAATGWLTLFCLSLSLCHWSCCQQSHCSISLMNVWCTKLARSGRNNNDLETPWFHSLCAFCLLVSWRFYWYCMLGAVPVKIMYVDTACRVGYVRAVG